MSNNNKIRKVSMTVKKDGTFKTKVEPKKNTKKKKKLSKRKLLSRILVVLGILILLYPVFANIVKERMIRGELTVYEKFKEQLANDEEYQNEVKDYNDKLLEPGMFYSSIPSTLDNLVDSKKPIARLKIPKITLDLPVYYGESEVTLRKSVAVLKNTSMPSGGLGTHSVITGHRGMRDMDIFLFVDKLEPGDHIYIDNGTDELSYKVVGQKLVDPNDTSSIKLDPERDQITLLTCDPPFLNYQRLLVNAERDEADEERRATAFKLGSMYGQDFEYSEYVKEEKFSLLDKLKNTNPYFIVTPTLILIWLLVLLIKKHKKKKKTDKKHLQ